MNVFYEDIRISTEGEVDIIDITDKAQKIVEKSKIKNGIVTIFNPGSTGTLTTIEFEPGLKKDFPKMLEKIAPKDIYYNHHETWHDDNGHSHVRASLMGPSITIPIKDGKILHGTWQQIVFVELDTKRRTRHIAVQIIGE